MLKTLGSFDQFILTDSLASLKTYSYFLIESTTIRFTSLPGVYLNILELIDLRFKEACDTSSIELYSLLLCDSCCELNCDGIIFFLKNYFFISN